MAIQPKYDVIRHVLASDVANAGTFTVAFPTGKTLGDYALGSGHRIWSNKYGKMLHGGTVGIVLTTLATITNNSGVTLEAGTEMQVQLNRVGIKSQASRNERYQMSQIVTINLGSPATLDDNGICKSQNRTGAGVMLINGALSDGELATSVATLDVPRNVIADSGGADTAVITVTGTDEYGNVMSEAITLNGATAVAGKKAFKTVTGVSSSATTANGFFLGTGDVLGLPVFLSNLGRVFRELEDGIAATAGTLVAGIATAATTTTGDVRGTYDPNSAANGAKAFTLMAVVDDPGNLGVTQA